MIEGPLFRMLRCFLDKDTFHFAEICTAMDYPTDLGGYYIRRLVQGGYIEKSGRGAYTITPKGKKQQILSHGASPLIERPRLNALIIARQEDSYVVLRRRRQPFIGIAEWPAGAINHGESLANAAQRLLLDRLRIVGKPTFVGFFRRIDRYNDFVFDDKLFAVHAVDLPPRVTIEVTSITGKSMRCTPQEIAKLERKSRSLIDIFAYVQAGKPGIKECVYQLELADLTASEEPQ
jgi:hypothetical protein